MEIHADNGDALKMIPIPVTWPRLQQRKRDASAHTAGMLALIIDRKEST